MGALLNPHKRLQKSMTGKKRFTAPLSLFALALLIRLLTAWPQQQPNYMDAAYYYVDALNLASGRGFVEDFLWNYLDNPGPPPRPSHLYWMPLTSMLAGLGMAVGGLSYRAAQIPFIIISALLAPISFITAYSLSGQRRHGWLAGLLAIFSGFYVPFWTAIDNFTPFAITGSLALLCAGVGSTDAKRGVGSREKDSPSSLQPPSSTFWLLSAGIFSGLGHLARADGLLLLIALLIYELRITNDELRSPELLRQRSRVIIQNILLLILGYLLVMTPWFVRNWLAVGSILPGAGSQTIWLSNYDDLFRYGRDLSAQTFLAQGLGPILQGRWWVLTTNLQTVLAVWGMIFLTPLAAIGFWQLRHHPLIQRVALYALLLFGVMTFIFAFPGARGGLFHSGTALLPFIYAAAVIGLDGLIDWAAARRRRWRASQARQVFGLGLVIMAMVLSGFIYYGRVLKNDGWNRADALYPTLAGWVQQQNPAALVMIGNPPAYRYHGGGLSVVVPNEDVETTLQAARRYGVNYLILDQNHPAPLTELYDQTLTHPALSLAQTFVDENGQPVYIWRLEIGE